MVGIDFLFRRCPEIDDFVQDIFPSELQEYIDYFLYCNGDPEVIFYPLPQSLNTSIVSLELATQVAMNEGNQVS